jgi:hypothetical protein
MLRIIRSKEIKLKWLQDPREINGADLIYLKEKVAAPVYKSENTALGIPITLTT